MKFADDNIVRFDTFAHASGARASGGFSGSIPAGVVYAAQRMRYAEEHDGRGLVIAILLCMACWAALGYFLLA